MRMETLVLVEKKSEIGKKCFSLKAKNDFGKVGLVAHSLVGLAIICTLSHATKLQFVSMLTSVLKMTKMATLFTTVTNTLNAIITKDHLHAHVKRDGLVPHTVQEAA